MSENQEEYYSHVFEDQIKIEEEIVKSLNKSLVFVQNRAVTTALRGISLDSLKHAEMYRSAITLLKGKTAVLDEKNLDMQMEIVSKHIKMEEELIEKINKIILNIQNEKISMLLKAILLDEKRHHNLLKRILKILVRGETITEDDWWDMTWKDVEELYLDDRRRF